MAKRSSAVSADTSKVPISSSIHNDLHEDESLATDTNLKASGSSISFIEPPGGPPNGAQEADDTSGSPAKKRRKKAVSCVACRRRKLKCDRGMPCGACRDRGEAATCEWESGTQPHVMMGTRDTATTAPLEARMDRMETLMAAIGSRLGVNTENAFPEGSTVNQDAIETLRTFGGNASPVASRSNSRESMDPALALLWKPASIISWPPISPRPPKTDTLAAALTALPDKSTLEEMGNMYFDTASWSHWVLPTEVFWQEALPTVENLRDARDRGDAAWAEVANSEQMNHYLRNLALVLGVCGHAMLYSPPSFFAQVAQRTAHTAAPRHCILVEVAQAVLDASEQLEKVHIVGLQAGLVLLTAETLLKGMSGRLTVLHFAPLIHQAFALGLDQEPSIQTPVAEAQSRLRLFLLLCFWEWGNLHTKVRNLNEQPRKHPYLFGPPGSSPWHDYVRRNGELLLPHEIRWLAFARIVNRKRQLDDMSEADALALTIELGMDLNKLRSEVEREVTSESFSKDAIISFSPAIQRLRNFENHLDRHVVALFKPYYTNMWLLASHRTARDTCFEAAKRIIDGFTSTLSQAMPGIVDSAIQESIEKMQALFEYKREVATRLVWTIEATLEAINLLELHAQQVDLHAAKVGADGTMQRQQAMRKCAVTKRLLVALSLRSLPARSVVSKLQQSVLARAEPGLAATQASLATATPAAGSSRRAKRARAGSIVGANSSQEPQRTALDTSSPAQGAAPLELLAGVSSRAARNGHDRENGLSMQSESDPYNRQESDAVTSSSRPEVKGATANVFEQPQRQLQAQGETPLIQPDGEVSALDNLDIDALFRLVFGDMSSTPAGARVPVDLFEAGPPESVMHTLMQPQQPSDPHSHAHQSLQSHAGLPVHHAEQSHTAHGSQTTYGFPGSALSADSSHASYQSFPSYPASSLARQYPSASIAATQAHSRQSTRSSELSPPAPWTFVAEPRR
ncbi:c6 transcription factor [Ceraceosorus bombacis]|uniref:C6 transcription factor n=1 Tax=Ceraceosorus bombacis TaxID=401625 RepID=A0A0P1B8Z5_9BASI|nr:c6 transcription factor [Ceraceosorus bombacis]